MTFDKINDFILKNYKLNDKEFGEVFKNNKMQLLSVATYPHTSGIFKTKTRTYYFCINEYRFNYEDFSLKPLKNPTCVIEAI